MKVTIKDIAKEANVSVSTVSLVLNHKPCRVSENTRKKIEEIALKYQYTVNQAARSLVTKKSNILGLIIPDIENLFFSSLSKNIEEYCRAIGYSLIIVNTNDHKNDDISLLKILLSRGVDGLFICVSNESYDDKEVEETLNKLPVPYVMVDRVYQDLDCNKVYFDNELGSFLAIQHLVKNGHRKIGCIASPESSRNGSSRVTGYIKAMEHFNCPIKECYIEDGDYRYQGGYDAGLRLIHQDVTAVFVCNDMMVLGFIKCLNEKHLRIPQDYSIISYDNILYPFTQGSEITSIEQNVAKLAITSCDVLLNQINNPKIEKQNICLSPVLIKKESVKHIK